MTPDEQQSRWHFTLHPSVTRHSSNNALPRWLGKYFHSTSAILVRRNEGPDTHDPSQPKPKTNDPEQSQHWTSRDHRKHRHIEFGRGIRHIPRHAKGPVAGIWHMTRFEYWNISWWVAQAFTWGSVVWVLNGFFAALPLFNPDKFSASLISTGWTAFVGATIFEIGSVFGMWEAWNRDDATSFGWSVATKWNEVEEDLQKLGAPKNLKSRNDNSSGISNGSPSNSDGSKMNFRKPGTGVDEAKFENIPKNESGSPPRIDHRRWVWFSTDTRYFREMGFLAAFFQMMGASIFWISGITAIPSIQNSISKHTGVLDGVFWTPQVVGGMGFVISSMFIMLESQKKWYRPEIFSIGWQVGLWNFIGGVGFTACGALGYGAAVNTGVEFQSVLCTFWGSWAFLIGSVVQWYESVNGITL